MPYRIKSLLCIKKRYIGFLLLPTERGKCFLKNEGCVIGAQAMSETTLKRIQGYNFIQLVENEFLQDFGQVLEK